MRVGVAFFSNFCANAKQGARELATLPPLNVRVDVLINSSYLTFGLL